MRFVGLWWSTASEPRLSLCFWKPAADVVATTTMAAQLQEGEGGRAKAYQVDQILEALDRLSAQRAALTKAQADQKQKETGKKRGKGKKR